MAIPELDVSARGGLLLGAYMAGRSTQPNLLTRGTTDQAIITGIATAASYGWSVSVGSVLRSVANRLPIPMAAPVANAVTAATGLTLARGINPHGGVRPAASNLAAKTLGAVGLAGLGADALELARGRRGGRLLAAGAMIGVGVAAWAKTRPGRAEIGSKKADGTYEEDAPRELNAGKTAALGVGTALLMYGAAHVESVLGEVIARGTANLLGGKPENHRMMGRIGATAASLSLGWSAIGVASAKLTNVGADLDVANLAAPTMPEVTGSPESGIPWDAQSREGARWLSEVLLADGISAVMQEPAKQPIRVYAALPAADSLEGRAELLLRELDRTKALERKNIAIFSPTGSGYVNYVACETFEYLTRGDCASMAIAYSVLPSAMSLTRTDLGTQQTELVVAGVTERLLAMPASERPRFFIFGESLGCKVSEEMFSGASDVSLRGYGLEAGVWVGTPAFTKWHKRVWGNRPQGEVPEVGPDSIYATRAISDWHQLSDSDQARVKYLLLQNGDDPVPKFEAPLSWRPPDWLGPEGSRPPGAPKGTSWLPVVTFIATFVDLLNALTTTPGVFQQGGHDYRVEIPDAIRKVWGLSASHEQMQRVNRALRERELGWELDRDWAEAKAKSGKDKSKAERHVAAEAAKWTKAGKSLTPEAITRLIEKDTRPGVEPPER